MILEYPDAGPGYWTGDLDAVREFVASQEQRDNLPPWRAADNMVIDVRRAMSGRASAQPFEYLRLALPGTSDAYRLEVLERVTILDTAIDGWYAAIDKRDRALAALEAERR